MRAQPAADLAAELIHAARRTGLARRISGQLAEIGFGMTVERQAAPAAILAAERINDFVATLGKSALPGARHPRVAAKGRPERSVFAARAGHASIANLPQVPRPIAQQVWEDWVFALYDVVTGTAKDVGGAAIGIEQNLRRGQILHGIMAQAPR